MTFRRLGRPPGSGQGGKRRQSPQERVGFRAGKICSGRGDRGFTLWELLLVLALMGFLMGSFIPHFTSSFIPIQKRMQEADVRRVEGALQLYKVDVGALPRHLEDLIRKPEGVKGWQGPYLKERPLSGPGMVYTFDSYGRVEVSP
ncbi:type II secretion system protein GspG [Acididesulfobacillus acetoxydans]|nr:type II secretion system protein GspG [Acididesulfobacillus acetoxydans]